MPSNSTPVVKSHNTAAIVAPVVVITIALSIIVLLGISIICVKYRWLSLIFQSRSHKNKVAANTNLHSEHHVGKSLCVWFTMVCWCICKRKKFTITTCSSMWLLWNWCSPYGSCTNMVLGLYMFWFGTQHYASFIKGVPSHNKQTFVPQIFMHIGTNPAVIIPIQSGYICYNDKHLFSNCMGILFISPVLCYCMEHKSVTVFLLIRIINIGIYMYLSHAIYWEMSTKKKNHTYNVYNRYAQHTQHIKYIQYIQIDRPAE